MNSKRLLDLTISILLTIVLSPVFLLIAIAIRLESKGPILYTSKRVGQGWKVFDFFKFRTMRINADQLIKDVEHLNAYNDDSNSGLRLKQSRSLISDEGWVSEAKAQEAINKSSFLKIENDPRITKVGKFLRNTSLDELPQLLNVLKGDMSLVGNRPLPIYEAETLTNDQDALRFLAPAGITGLWQVTERGGVEVSEQRRKQLDNTYAKEHSFWYDLRILWNTLPAAIQKADV